MPTGYTSAIEKGISFEEFALNCARAFGALITMRDEPSDAPIPEEFKPNDYNARELEAAQAHLSELLEMPLGEATKLAEADYKRISKEVAKAREKSAALKAKYEAMLKKVRAWNPPTNDHAELKTFMLSQITESIRFDCSDSNYWNELVQRAKVSGPDWLAEQITKAKRDIAYHTKAHDEEVKRVHARNEWVRNLRESLRAATEKR